MKDTQVSRPVVIALAAAILLGAYLLFFRSSEEVVPPPPPPAAPVTAATGATGKAGAKGSTSATGATGADQPTAAERKQQRQEARRRKLMEAAREKGIPFPIYTALNQGKVVILFFNNPNDSASQKVNTAVKQVYDDWGSKKMMVVRDDIKNVSRYAGIAKATEITQTPGLVIVYKEKADTWMGYIDQVALDSRVKRLTDR